MQLVSVLATVAVISTGYQTVAGAPLFAQVIFEFEIDGGVLPHAEHIPYSGRIGIVSSATVASGEATLSQVDFLIIRAGIHTLTLSDIHPVTSNHRILFSPDGNAITGFSQTGPSDPNTWLFAQSLPTATDDTDNVVHLGHATIFHETLFSEPGNSVVSTSNLSGIWERQRFRCWCWWWVILIPIVIIAGIGGWWWHHRYQSISSD